jgi:addiction module HigA family antidote
MLQSEFLEPLGISQSKLAAGIHVPFQRVNEIVRGRRGITPSTSLRLSKFLGTSPGFWMNLQLRCDLHRARDSEAEQLDEIKPHEPFAESLRAEDQAFALAESPLASIDTSEFVTHVGHELVSEIGIANSDSLFEFAGPSHSWGVLKKLERLLPSWVRVGSGRVIDSLGNASQLMDVVLYREDSRPIFEVGAESAESYFPCEGVIAVGEIIESIDSMRLKDTFEKFRSVKCLRPYADPSPEGPPEIKTLSVEPKPDLLDRATAHIPESAYQAFDRNYRTFAFILAGSSSFSIESAGEAYAGFAATTGSQLSPDILVSMDGSIVCPTMGPPESFVGGADVESAGIYSVKYPEKSFAFLHSKLYGACTAYRSPETLNAYDRYFTEDEASHLPSGGIVTPLRSRD